MIEGDSSVEAAQARVSADGTSYTTLKERLDSEHGQLSTQLAQSPMFSRHGGVNDLSVNSFNALKNMVEENIETIEIDGSYKIEGELSLSTDLILFSRTNGSYYWGTFTTQK